MLSMGIEAMVLLTSLAILLLVPPIWNHLIPTSQRLKLKSESSNVTFLNTKPQEYSEYFASLRGIAILAVIVIHVTYFYVYYTESFTTSMHVANNALRFAVAAFFIASGALLSQPQLTVTWLRHFYTRRFIAIGIPYGVVTFYLVWFAGGNITDFIYQFLTGTASVPFYFIVALFQLYILYPVLYHVAQQRWFVFLTLLLSMFEYLTGTVYSIFGVTNFIPYLFYFVWGIYMRSVFTQAQERKTLVWWPWVFCIGLYAVLQLYYGFDRFFNGQYFYSIAICMIWFNLYSLHTIPDRALSVLGWFGQHSLWIFLLHFTVMLWIFPLFHDTTSGTVSISSIIGFALASVFSSILFSEVVRRIYAKVQSVVVETAKR